MISRGGGPLGAGKTGRRLTGGKRGVAREPFVKAFKATGRRERGYVWYLLLPMLSDGVGGGHTSGSYPLSFCGRMKSS